MSLEVTHLQCQRGDKKLFSDLSFVLKSKQLMRIEGQNGTGKTTLLRTLCGLYQPDKGEVLWNNISIKKQAEEYLKDLFYLGHSNAIKADLSALENLRINTSLTGNKYSEAVLLQTLNDIGLFGSEYKPAAHLSQGQKRRVALAGLLLSNAKLWILDEPFVALDGFAVKLLQDVIAKHVEDDGMVVLTTHQEVPLTSGEILRVSLDQNNHQSISDDV
ncbi:MAG: heme exporter protein A [Cocleimonas sp.]|jgi:heme exporter protein A